MSWQDISTAPKDGTVVMFHSPKGRWFIAPSRAWKESAEATRAIQLEVYKATGQFPDHGYTPTHWQPLTEPFSEPIPSPFPDITETET